jgi:hypothetical protein
LHEHPFTAGLGAPPAIDAYVVTGLKEGAELLLEGLDGEPVLALSRQGLGRTAALTTDLNAWAEDFASWAELPALLGTAVRWLQAQPEAYSVSAVAAGGEVRVVVDAVRDGEYLSGERLDVRYGGAHVPLTQTGPGRYEATLQAGEGGSVVILQGGEIVARSAVGVDLSVDRDAAELFLREIARRSGGEVIDNLETYAPPPGREALTLWPYLALLGLVVFVLELAYRRFQDWRPSLGLATGASQPAPRAK